jgi:outer membrane lipoprotein SlyB
MLAREQEDCSEIRSGAHRRRQAAWDVRRRTGGHQGWRQRRCTTVSHPPRQVWFEREEGQEQTYLGASVGSAVGCVEGPRVGIRDGLSVGTEVGVLLGDSVGASEGLWVGESVGAVVGRWLGCRLGPRDGDSDGTRVGDSEGT